jgi:geranylgeranyl diphosphate synthase type II
LNKKLNYLVKKININLSKYLKSQKEYPPIIYDAVRYSVFAGGKRIRPVLLLLTANSCGLALNKVMPVACALEMIHTYSLIHDDLPAMDNDDYRRGQLTSHKKFGEAIAILAGDALLTKAFETICNCKKYFSSDMIIKVIEVISDAAGINGMVGGQVADIIFENKKISKKTLNFIHSHKTGALIKASILSAAILSDANKKELKLWNNLGEIVGLIFQITDDILDITSTTKNLGKTAGKDIKQKKATFPSVYGLKKSEQIVINLLLEAKKILYKINKPTEDILNLIEFIAVRKK